MATEAPFTITLCDLADIRPTEHTLADAVHRLAEEIKMVGIWTHPLVIDRQSLAVIKGHTRLEAAVALGLRRVPVIKLDFEDPAVDLGTWEPGAFYTPAELRAAAISGNRLAPNSIRLTITEPLPQCRYKIGMLREDGPTGRPVAPARPQPSRVQILIRHYHDFGARVPLRTSSASGLELESAEMIVPHPGLRRQLLADPAMAALLQAAPCRIALGRQGDAPFRLKTPELLLLPPVLLNCVRALAAAARWGIEASFARQAFRFDHEGLSSLLRHGAALIQNLPESDRRTLLELIPESLHPELIHTNLVRPSAPIVSWLGDLVAQGEAIETAGRRSPASSALELPVESLLVSNGDSRIVLDPRSGKNKYGTTPRPRPEAVHFSSSTASSISDYGFLYCDVLRRDLLNHLLESDETPQSAHARLCNALIGELADLCEVDPDNVDGVIAASGTDTEILALVVARAAAPDQRLVNILVAPEETGRGVKLAGAGLYFDALAATGAQIAMGQPIWPDAAIEIIEVAIRDAKGRPLPVPEIDRAFLEAGTVALESGARVLAHQLIGSKTGLSAPSDASLAALVALAPDRVDVVVDSCQMRVDFPLLGRKLRNGWMVQVSGSKALTGPPFSGALLLPTELRSRKGGVRSLMRPGIGFSEDWSAFWSKFLYETEGNIGFGAAFRWLSAILETRLLLHVPEALRTHMVNRFRKETTARLNGSSWLKPLEIGEPAPQDVGGFLSDHSIVSFQVFGRTAEGNLAPLASDASRQLFEMLNQDVAASLPDLDATSRAVLQQEFHIGQPVDLGVGPYKRTVLRLVIGVRFFTIVGLAGPSSISAALESEISDMMRAFDKLEILAENWWRLARP